ncbi:hypothetical protein LTR84_000469 [Exophiala bonariae]|uniref:Xylanolytic transcriptional activator regulatory domain-containing protein n=1 Tax=Exophiala bonariae TaxID=1690606 RepID=A0AAV9NUN1_9EURO|nr:hypothetical protein LTR84_000469 [Exophiala bonariae]
MAEVPENQKIEEVLPTIINHDFAATAQSLLPDLSHSRHAPVRIVRFADDDSQFFNVKPVLESEIGLLSTKLWGKGTQFILDFGLHLVGHVSFRIEAEGLNIDAPCRLNLTFGESPIDVIEDMTGVDTWISTSWLPDEVINIDFMPEDVALPRRYAFRYLRVRIVDTSPKYKVKFSEFCCTAVSSVASSTQVELYDYHDPLLNTIDEISMLTLRDCMQTVFEDGPRRDRRVWIGDLRLQALTNYHTLRDYNLAKRCLYLFAAVPRSDSSLPACLFEKPVLIPATDYIVDYDTLFGVIVYDYVVATGDLATGRELWPTIQGSLLKAISHVDPETHLFVSSKTTAWKFLDWAENLDTSAGLHGLLLYSLERINALASLLSISPQPYTQLISQLRDAASSFISPHSQLFISGPHSQISLASAAWLTLSGAFPVATCRNALLGAMSHPDTITPLTPYLYHHIVDALATVSLFSEAIDLIKKYWGGMVNVGADTFWECFDETDARRSPYGDVRNNSFCHAWSCSPSWLLRVRLSDHLRAEVKEGVSIEELERRHVQRTSPKRRKRRFRDSPGGSSALEPQASVHLHILPAINGGPRNGHLDAEWNQTGYQPSRSSQTRDLTRLDEIPEGSDAPGHNAVAVASTRPAAAQRGTISSSTSRLQACAVPPTADVVDDVSGDAGMAIPPAPAVSYLGNNGILQIFARDSHRIATNDAANVSSSSTGLEDNLPPPELQQSFADTYFNHCWPWCPVLDKATFWQNSDTMHSPLLVNALALLGTQIRPPIIQHATAAEYYNRAKMLFYMDQDSNPIVCLQAIMLFYWWAPRGPSQVHKDAAWWWTGIAIKYAQQVGLHREPKNIQDVGGEAMQGLRRRIWWTLFARERLTSICQGRPCTINPKDCDVLEPTVADFGPSHSTDPRAEIFVHWVRLCAIIGRVGQHLSHSPEQAAFPAPLAEELVKWTQNLPSHLSLSTIFDREQTFDRDVLALHLPYLTTVTVLHLNWSTQHPSQPWPEAYTAAVLSASCVTHIFKTLLARGEIKFLGAISSWHVAVAIVALLYTQRIEGLAESGAEDIRVLKLTLGELARIWPTTEIFVKGFDRLKAFENLPSGKHGQGATASAIDHPTTSSPLSDVDWFHGIDWRSYFPNVTVHVSGIAAILLAEQPTGFVWEDMSWLADPAMHLQNLFDTSDATLDPFMENLSALNWLGE